MTWTGTARMCGPSAHLAGDFLVSQIHLLHLEDSSLDAELIRVRLAKDGLKLAVHRVVGHDDYLEALQTRSST